MKRVNLPVFWTRIIYETTNSLELKTDFPLNSYEFPALQDKYFKTLIYSNKVIVEKIPFLIMLDGFEIFFDKNIHKPYS